MTKDDRRRLLHQAMLRISKEQKRPGVVHWGDETPCTTTGVIPTGSLGLDLALGVGGWPQGRICEIIGAESTGKTTLALHAIAQAQKMDMEVLLVDAEHAFDRDYAAVLGVDLSRLIICKPDNGTQALDIVQDLVQTGTLGLCVVDSVSALTPRSEAEGDISEQEVGSQARLMSKAMRILTPLLGRTGCALLFLNQIRFKVGVVYGNPETTSGGNALKFYASCRVQLYRQPSKDIMNADGERIGGRVVATVIKNKLAVPFRKASFDIIFGRGVDRFGELVDLGSHYGLIQRTGSWYAYGQEKLGQGRAAAVATLQQKPELCELLEEALRQRLRAQPTVLQPVVEEEDEEEELTAVNAGDE